MKKILGVFLFLVIFSSTAFAAPQFGIGARVGHNFYRDSSMDLNATGFGTIANVDYSNKSSWMYGINGTVKFTDNWSVELAVDRISSSQNDFKFGTVSAKAGDITQTPVTLTARFHYPVWIFSPYVGAGLGYYFRSYDKDAAFWAATTAVDIDNGWGYHVNAGTEIFLNEAKNLALDIDFKYVWTKADIKATNGAAQLTGTMKLDSFTAGLGLKYYF